MIHLTLNQISAYIDAELPEASVELVRLHLSSCLECTERFGHIEEQEEALARLLVNDPGDAFFASFADRVLGAERAPQKKSAPPAPRPALEAAPPALDAAPKPEPSPRQEAPKQEALKQEVAHKPEAPPKLEATPKQETATPKPLSAPHPLPTPMPSPQTPTPTPKLAPSRPAKPPRAADAAPRTHHATRSKPRRARFLVPAAALLLVASAVAVVATRSGRLTLPFDIPASAPFESADPAPSSGPTPTAPTPASGSEDLLERATTAGAEAERLGTAEAHDAAAAAWSAALSQLENDPEELAAGRREVAAARYAAWAHTPTPERRTAAMEAVRTYLLVAPPGAQRDQAWKWLAALKR